MTEPTDHEIIAGYIAKRDWLKAKAEKFKLECQPVQEQMKLLEGEMLRRLNERGQDNSSGDSGVAYKERTMQVSCADKPAFHQFCLANYDTYGKDLLTANISKEGLGVFIEKTKTEQHPNGQLPPGININYEIHVKFRR